jgi:hypothetical protein
MTGSGLLKARTVPLKRSVSGSLLNHSFLHPDQTPANALQALALYLEEFLRKRSPSIPEAIVMEDSQHKQQESSKYSEWKENNSDLPVKDADLHLPANSRRELTCQIVP